jgi:zinc transporter 1/2/3
MSDFTYDVPLRIGMIFVVLVTSGIGVFAPILITKLPLGGKSLGNTLQMLKQFGTGIIISTAFIHVCQNTSRHVHHTV